AKARFAKEAGARARDIGAARSSARARPNPTACCGGWYRGEAKQDSWPKPAVAVGRAPGGQEILTSLRSTASHGASPSCHTHSRKPAYSIADRRVSQATFRLSGKRDSSQSRSDGAASFRSIRPSSFSSHFLRDAGSEGSIGPKLIRSKEAMT